MATAALIIGGTALVGGLMGSAGAQAQNRLSRRQLRFQKRAAANLRPKKILKTAMLLQPAIRAQIMAALGPQFQQRIAASLGRRGLTSTGLGAFFQTAAIAAPGVTAATQSLDRALQIKQAQAAALTGVGQNVAPQVNPLLAGLAGGLQSGLTAASVGSEFGLFTSPGQTGTNLPSVQTPAGLQTQFPGFPAGGA